MKICSSHLHDWMLAIVSAFQHRSISSSLNALSALMSSWVIFQYNYMGSDTNAATRKIIQVFNLVNNVSFKVWFVL